MNEGWIQHVDQRGTPCVYCDTPSTQTIVIEEDQYKAGLLHKRSKRVGVCDDHFPDLVYDQERVQAVNFRRRGAKDVEQLRFDVGREKDEWS